MSVDYKWMSEGGLLLDGTGDLAYTNTPMECATSMVRSRLKAAIDGYKLYRIGADLDSFPGNTSNPDTELAIKRQVLQALTYNYFPSSVYQVRTLRMGGEIQIFVFLNQTLVATASVQVAPTAV